MDIFPWKLLGAAWTENEFSNTETDNVSSKRKFSLSYFNNENQIV